MPLYNRITGDGSLHLCQARSPTVTKVPNAVYYKVRYARGQGLLRDLWSLESSVLSDRQVSFGISKSAYPASVTRESCLNGSGLRRRGVRWHGVHD